MFPFFAVASLSVTLGYDVHSVGLVNVPLLRIIGSKLMTCV